MNLLDQLKHLKTDRALNPDRAWKKHMLKKLRQDLYEQGRIPGIWDVIKSPFSLKSLTLAPVRVIASFVLVFILGGTGLTFASKSAIPGDILYPIKTASEEIERLIAVSAENKIQVNKKLADERAQELNILIAEKAPPPLIQTTLENLVGETESMVKILEQQASQETIEPEIIQVAERAIETNITILKAYTVAPIPPDAIPETSIQPTETETPPSLPSESTSPSTAPVEAGEFFQPQPSSATPAPSDAQTPQQSIPVGTASTPPSAKQGGEPTQSTVETPTIIPPIVKTTPEPSESSSQPKTQPEAPQPTGSEPATASEPTVIQTPVESTPAPAEESLEIRAPEEISVPEETYSEIVKSIDTLEKVKDDVTVTHIKVSSEEQGTQKVEEKIQQVEQELQTHQEAIKTIPDPVKQEQAINLINEAQFYLNVSNAELKEKELVDSFEHARESDKILDQVKTIIPPKPSKTQTAPASSSSTESAPTKTPTRPVKKR